MKKTIIGIAIGIITTLCTLVITIPVYAKIGLENIAVTYSNIKIFIDGVEKAPSDEPFILNGRTYVPLRFISESLGKEVAWEESINTIYIGALPDNSNANNSKSKVTNFISEIKDYQSFNDFYTDGMTVERINLANPLCTASLTFKAISENKFHVEGDGVYAASEEAAEMGYVNIAWIEGIADIFDDYAVYYEPDVDGSIIFSVLPNGNINVKVNGDWDGYWGWNATLEGEYEVIYG